MKPKFFKTWVIFHSIYKYDIYNSAKQLESPYYKYNVYMKTLPRIPKYQINADHYIDYDIKQLTPIIKLNQKCELSSM